MSEHLGSGSTGDPAVDALVDHAAQAAQLPAGEHRERYAQVLDGLERELDADPAAAMRGPGQGAVPVPGDTPGERA
ncbi:hypothetical protein JOF48_003873 [Arthrobacter stackebrandtii]|uniref:Uncharacterized protein n=1 Tax=Arthrobacter stackebrandtii TaxID=272161 RepID=A0ABS4Z1Z9_9MICC|nr:hypothetical protein [Arthrobacter stackebrandtii]MBP2415074.1 hypothetical protein [Arthrobacter stackebrandtii]PYH00784.1 hypothetical protein CVV67_07395 [Arthrobacter stackebrandtii]